MYLDDRSAQRVEQFVEEDAFGLVRYYVKRNGECASFLEFVDDGNGGVYLTRGTAGTVTVMGMGGSRKTSLVSFSRRNGKLRIRESLMWHDNGSLARRTVRTDEGTTTRWWFDRSGAAADAPGSGTMSE